jgi:hypothetical protein
MHGLGPRQRVAVRIEKELGRHTGGCGLAAVVARQRLRRLLPIEHEGAAADAGRLRLHERQHHLRRDAGVDRAAALAQHREAGFRGERMRGDNHVVLGRDERFRRQTACAFGKVQGLRGRGGEQERERCGEEGAEHAAQHRRFFGVRESVTATREVPGFCHFVLRYRAPFDVLPAFGLLEHEAYLSAGSPKFLAALRHEA